MTQATLCDKVTEKQAYALGMEAYLYFFPLVLMELTRRQTTNAPLGERPGFGPANSFSHMRAYPTADFRAVVRPNFDTLYSSGWVDLSNEPVILSIPDFGSRYYLMPILDMWTDVIAVPGWRTTGNKPQNYALVMPGFKGSLPQGVEPIEVSTSNLWIIGRIKTDGPADYAAVHALQDQLKLVPLSQWGKGDYEPALKVDSSVDMKTPPLDAIVAMSHDEYFGLAGKLWQKHKPHVSDWSTVARLKRAGFAGDKFDLSGWDAALVAAFKKGAGDAISVMKEKTKDTGIPVNGWAMNTNTMGVYGNFYFKRAIVALVGLGANQPEDAIYPLNFADADGKPLTGENKYVLHFDKTQLPPVAAFWSVTMYDADGFQVANALDRFAVSSWMPFKYNADGSLDLYIQHENPGADKEANWLPAPSSGVLGVTMRLYAPDFAALNGDWVPPAIKKV